MIATSLLMAYAILIPGESETSANNRPELSKIERHYRVPSRERPRTLTRPRRPVESQEQ